MLFDVAVVTLVVFREFELLGVNGGGDMMLLDVNGGGEIMLPLVVVDVEVVVVVAPDAPPSP